MKPQPTPSTPQPEPNPPELQGEARARFLAAIAEGHAQSEAGQMIDDDEVWRRMAEKGYGPFDDDDSDE